MDVKISLRAVPRKTLSEHQLKRCRAVARGRAWQLIEEDILWWSLDKKSWQPVDEALVPHRRRWLMVENEDGIVPAALWEERGTLDLPPRAEAASPFHLPQDETTLVR